MKQRHLLNIFVVLTLGLLLITSAVRASGRETYLSLVQGGTKSPCGHVVVQILPDRNVPKDWKMRWYVSIHTRTGCRLPLGFIEDRARLADDSKLVFYIPAGEYKLEISRKSEQWARGVSKQFNLAEGVWKCDWPGTVKVDDVTVPVEYSGVTIVNISYQNARVLKDKKNGRTITSYIWEHPRLLVDKGSATDLREEEPTLYPLVKYAELDKIDETHLIESLKKDGGYIPRTALLSCEELDARLISLALEEKSLKLDMAVARILAKAGDESAVMPLIDILKQGSATAAWTLGELEAKEAVNPLIAALKDESVVLRNNAAYALAQIKDERAVDSLIKATKDTDRFEGELLVLNEPEIYTVYWMNRANGTIGDCFPTPSDEVRKNAIYALGQIGGEKATNALLNFIDDADASVQMQTAFALGNHSNEKVVDALIKKLKSDHQIVRWMAVQVLGNISAKKALNSLEDLAENDSDEMVREAAQKALEKIEKVESERRPDAAMDTDETGVQATKVPNFSDSRESGTDVVIRVSPRKYANSGRHDVFVEVVKGTLQYKTGARCQQGSQLDLDPGWIVFRPGMRIVTGDKLQLFGTRYEASTELVVTADGTLQEAPPKADAESLSAESVRPEPASLAEKQKSAAAQKERSFRRYSEAGSAHEAREDWDKAIEAYTQALTYEPGDAEVKGRLATCRHNSCLSQAREAESKGDLDTAIRLYTTAISHKRVPSTQARLDSARKALQERAESESRRQEYAKWLKLAETAEKEGSPTTAMQLYKEAQACAEPQDSASLQAKIDALKQQIAEKQPIEERANVLVDYGSLNHRLDLNLKGRGWVQDVCFSPAGDKIASTDKGTVRIWNAGTGTCSRILKGHAKEPGLVCFSRDGKLVATGEAWDKVIKIWDSSTGQCLRTIQTGHRKDLLDICFSPDGKFIVSASDDKTLKLWDMEKGYNVRTFQGHGAGVFCVDFAPDGRSIASGSWDKTIKLWDVQSGGLLKTLTGHKSTIESLAFSPDGDYIAACEYWDNKVTVWDVKAAQPVVKKELNCALCVAFSPTGDYVASGDAYGQVHILNVKNGEWVKKFRSHKGFLGFVRINAVAFSPDVPEGVLGRVTPQLLYSSASTPQKNNHPTPRLPGDESCRRLKQRNEIAPTG